MGAGESVCQSISRSISLLRERGVCVVLRQQHWAQTRPRTREKRPTPGDTGRGGDMDHTSDDRKNTSTDFNLVWCRRLYMLLDIMICPTCCSLTNSGVIF